MLEELLTWLILRLGLIIGDGSRYYHLFLSLLEKNGLSLQTLATLASLSFAIWKWWSTRDAALFRKVERILSKNEKKLEFDRDALVQSIVQPNLAERRFLPSFIEPSLYRMLRYFNTRSFFRSLIRPAATKRLSKIQNILETRLSAQNKQIHWTQSQLATCFAFQGSVHAAKANKTSDADAARLEHEKAANKFDMALSYSAQAENHLLVELYASEGIRAGYYSSVIEFLEEKVQDIEQVQDRSDALALNGARLLHLMARAQKLLGLTLPLKGYPV